MLPYNIRARLCLISYTLIVGALQLDVKRILNYVPHRFKPPVKRLLPFPHYKHSLNLINAQNIPTLKPLAEPAY